MSIGYTKSISRSIAPQRRAAHGGFSLAARTAQLLEIELPDRAQRCRFHHMFNCGGVSPIQHGHGGLGVGKEGALTGLGVTVDELILKFSLMCIHNSMPPNMQQLVHSNLP